VVKLKHPVDKAEKKARFVLTEDPDMRVSIRLICDLPFPPVERVNEDEVELADQGDSKAQASN
jgi:hypothetical protein